MVIIHLSYTFSCTAGLYHKQVIIIILYFSVILNLYDRV